MHGHTKIKFRRTVFVEIGCSRWIVSSAVTFAAAVLWFSKRILFNIRRPFSFSCGFWPPFISADDVFPLYVHAFINVATAALDTSYKVAVLFTDAAAKRAPTMCPLWKSDKSPILQYFHTQLLLITICNALALSLRSVKKQTNEERCSHLIFFQCSQRSFIPTLFRVPLFCPSPVIINTPTF